MRKIHYAAVVVGAATLALSAVAMATPMAGRMFVENVSPSMELGWYVKTGGNVDTGSIVVFTLPEHARDMAEEKGIGMEIPIMKRVVAVDRDRGVMTVEGDFGGVRSFDSTYYGDVPIGNVAGVYRKMRWDDEDD